MTDFVVQDGIWDSATKIADVRRKRHTVIFPEHDGRPTVVDFCNNCGCAFTLNNHCADCGMRQD